MVGPGSVVNEQGTQIIDNPELFAYLRKEVESFSKDRVRETEDGTQYLLYLSDAEKPVSVVTPGVHGQVWYSYNGVRETMIILPAEAYRADLADMDIPLALRFLGISRNDFRKGRMV